MMEYGSKSDVVSACFRPLDAVCQKRLLITSGLAARRPCCLHSGSEHHAAKTARMCRTCRPSAHAGAVVSQDGILRREQLSPAIIDRLHRMTVHDVRKVFRPLLAAENSNLRGVRSSCFSLYVTPLQSAVLMLRARMPIMC